MYHRIEFIGRLGKEPELKTLQSGDVCELSVATDIYKNSEKQTSSRFVMPLLIISP